MNNQNAICLKDAQVLTKNGLKKACLIINNGLIDKICPDAPDDFGGEVIIATDCLAIPSFVDMHVHLREPGFSYKETIKTGTCAGAAGGYTTLCTMPNLNPAPDSLQNLKKQLDIIHKDACIDVIPFATITKDRLGKELVDYSSLAPFVAGFSDDGSGVQSEEIMILAMEGIAKTGKILAAHCEVNDLLNGGYIHEGEYSHKNNHLGICSESEWKEVERDINLSQTTGCRLHVCHISTQESVNLIRQAKKDGIKVTCETAPHYLSFHDLDLCEHGRFKMNPPIRSIKDREALREGLIDGTIDVVATDHAPHSFEEKNRGLEKSAMGVVGLETAFAAVYTSMVDSGLMPFSRLVETMSVNPRRILGLPDFPYLFEGAKADIVVVNINDANIVDPSKFKSMGKSSPFEGMKLKGNIKYTIHNGCVVFKI